MQVSIYFQKHCTASTRYYFKCPRRRMIVVIIFISIINYVCITKVKFSQVELFSSQAQSIAEWGVPGRKSDYYYK